MTTEIPCVCGHLQRDHQRGRSCCEVKGCPCPFFWAHMRWWQRLDRGPPVIAHIQESDA